MATHRPGVIFDLDGTLVDSRLDFTAIREEANIPAGEPILEFLAGLPEGVYRSKALQIIEKHEWAGARRAELIAGVGQMLAELERRHIPVAVYTRNARAIAKYTLENCQIRYSILLAREDAEPKPSPDGIIKIAKQWRCECSDLLMVGDYLYDIESGKNAGAKTVLFVSTEETPPYAFQADHVIRNMADLINLL